MTVSTAPEPRRYHHREDEALPCETTAVTRVKKQLLEPLDLIFRFSDGSLGLLQNPCMLTRQVCHLSLLHTEQVGGFCLATPSMDLGSKLGVDGLKVSRHEVPESHLRQSRVSVRLTEVARTEGLRTAFVVMLILYILATLWEV